MTKYSRNVLDTLYYVYLMFIKLLIYIVNLLCSFFWPITFIFLLSKHELEIYLIYLKKSNFIIGFKGLNKLD